MSLTVKNAITAGAALKSCPTDAWEGRAAIWFLLAACSLVVSIYRGETLFPIIKDKETLFRVADAAIGYFEEHAKAGERFRLMLGEDRRGRVQKSNYGGVQWMN